ncbi:MAG TPA: hypothetical protein ENK57_06475 [Polyangiaceae bacterium]|nr:hypothetical protein [Polyangiaceae bacterium]
MNWKWTRAVAVGVLGLAASGAIGCAEEREPINRVQNDALAKSFFVGADLADDADNPEFYANGPLLDIGYGAAQSGLFTAFYSNDLSIIRWQITEDYLIGRLAYERIEGTDGKGAGQEINDGQVLYVFKIKSHFDIRRAYNPSTGEELNVVEENTTDRLWYEREYMRVDWSSNEMTDAYDFDTGAVYGLFFGVEYEPLSYYINDPNHPHAPHFEPDDGYFDITTKAGRRCGSSPGIQHAGGHDRRRPDVFLLRAALHTSEDTQSAVHHGGCVSGSHAACSGVAGGRRPIRHGCRGPVCSAVRLAVPSFSGDRLDLSG